MLCVADVGNTNTVLGLYEGDQLLHSWRLRTTIEKTIDEWGLTLKSLFDLSNIQFSTVDAFIVSSVVPSVTNAFRHVGNRFFGTETLVVGPGIKTGLPINYDNPREVGADRVVNAVAAFARLAKACIVVDFGTATTFDCISDKGEYMGGAIVPGIRISLDALVGRTAKLPKVDILRPKHAIGRNTVESMQSGVLFGYVALVDGLSKRLQDEMGVPTKIIATGGLAELVARDSKAIDVVAPDLTLEGLRIIYLRNSK